jgi:hypothetical protein
MYVELYTYGLIINYMPPVFTHANNNVLLPTEHKVSKRRLVQCHVGRTTPSTSAIPTTVIYVYPTILVKLVN